MGLNIHGNKNEIDIVNYLNNKKIKELNPNMKNFIIYISLREEIFINDNDVIKADYIKGKYKSDITITIQNKTFNISIKMGKGNSLHQENLNQFIEVTSKKLNLILVENIQNDLYTFINSTLSAKELYLQNPSLFKNINEFLDINKDKLLRHFLVEGVYCNYHTDYIYHGTIANGVGINIDDLIDSLIKTNTNNNHYLKIANLTIQAWNRTNQSKRGYLQVKWANMGNDILLVLKEI